MILNGFPMDFAWVPNGFPIEFEWTTLDFDLITNDFSNDI